MSRRHRSIAALIIAFVLMGTIVGVRQWVSAAPAGSIRHAGGSPGDRAIPVRVAPARQGDLRVTVSALGTVAARNTAVVHARIDGLLQHIAFQEGTKVITGQTLVEIDPRPFQVAVDQARGQLARDQAQLDSAQLDLDRYRGLLKQDSIAKQQVDDQVALVHQLRGAVQADRAQLASTELQLSFTRVTAPIGGRLGLRQVDVGNQVHATDANGIVTITETQPIDVVFAVPADHLPQILDRLRRGERFDVEVFDREGKTSLATGQFASMDNQIDPNTNTIKLKAEFANTDERLFPNQFVNVRLTVDTLSEVMLVPVAALQQGAPGAFVYVVQNAGEGTKPQVKLQVVKPGPTDSDTVAIIEGLKPGEQVVIDGADKLRDGMTVEIAGAGQNRRPANGDGSADPAASSRP